MQEKKKFIYSVISAFLIMGLFWGVWIWRAYAWVSYKEQMVTILGTVLIGLVTGMMAVAYLMFRMARVSYMQWNQKGKMIAVIISLLVIILCNFFMLQNFREYGYTISTIASIEEKVSKGGNYYFQIKDSSEETTITFQCEKELYDALSTEKKKSYSMQYRKLNFGKEKAVLGYVDVENVIQE